MLDVLNHKSTSDRPGEVEEYKTLLRPPVVLLSLNSYVYNRNLYLDTSEVLTLYDCDYLVLLNFEYIMTTKYINRLNDIFCRFCDPRVDNL